MFKKPKRNFRSKKHESDSENEESFKEYEHKVADNGQIVEDATAVPSTTKKLKKKKKKEDTLTKSSSGASVLSFAEDALEGSF